MTPWKKKWPAIAGLASFVGLCLLPRKAKAKIAVKPSPPKVIAGSITFTASGSVTETIPNFVTGVEYKKTWTKAEWDKRTAALNAGDPYMDDSWKRQSEMTDEDWARYEARANTTVA